MSELDKNLEQGQVDILVNELHQNACSLNLYEGPPPSELPEYLRRRLILILQSLLELDEPSQAKFVLEVKHRPRNSSRYVEPQETVTYQLDHGVRVVVDMTIESYYYEEAHSKTHIELVRRDTREPEYFINVFDELVQFFKGNGYGEDIASMGSYDILAHTVRVIK